MAVNRYTKLTPTTYNPRTLQELMVAPSYMRKQHDLADEAIGQYETEIAKVDPLTVHSELAMQEQKRLQDELSGYADELASNGFSNYNKSNLIRFNKKYQNAVSPTGIIGKVNAAKKQYDLEKKNFLNTAMKMNHSMEDALRNWEIHSKKYEDSFDGENVNNIDSLFAPKYYDYLSEAKDLFGKAGVTVSNKSGGSSDIVKDEDGTYVLNKKWENSKSNNIKQLKAAAKYLNNLVNNPNSDAYKSFTFEGKTTDSVLQELEGLSDVFVKSSTTTNDTRTKNNYTPYKTSDSDTVKKGNQILALPDSYHQDELIKDNPSLKEINTSIQQLRGKEYLSDEEKGRLNGLELIKRDADKELAKNPEYIKTKRLYDEWNRNNKDNIFNSTTDIGATGIRVNSIKENPYADKLSRMENDELTSLKYIKSNYTFAVADSKTNTKLKLANETATRVFKNKGIFQGPIKLTTVTNTDGKPLGNLTPNDIDNLENLISQSDDINIVSLTPNNANGRGQLTFEAKIDTDTSYNLDYKYWGNDDIGGKDNKVKFTIEYDELSNHAGIANIVNSALEFTRDNFENGDKIYNASMGTLSLKNYRNQKWGSIPKATLKQPGVARMYKSGLLSKATELGVEIVRDKDGVGKFKSQEDYNRVIQAFHEDRIIY